MGRAISSGTAATRKATQHAIIVNARVFFFFFLVDGVTEVTRSARKYCKTGATLGQGGMQAYQAPSRGLNNPLKLL